MIPFLKNIKTIAFDADDTLWENENFFRDAEKEYYYLMKEFANKETLEKALYKTEIGHLNLYGYGIKSFILSMIESALEISKHQVSPEIISKIIEIGKKMLKHPIRLLKNVEETLTYFKSKNIKLIIATKGDLIDQESKLKQSGLAHYFDHIEIMTDKKINNYLELLKQLNIKPLEFVMIGNSLKSDIIPVTEIEGKAIHIPYHTTWMHEEAEKQSISPELFMEIKSLQELLD